MPKDYQAKHSFSTERPETLVVCCSDGRWHPQVEEFCKHTVDERADLYAVPGGAALFDWHNSSHHEARVLEEAFRLLADHHNLSSIWLIAHQGCAYYHSRYQDRPEEEIVERQIQDMQKAQDIINRWYPKFVVRQIYASVAEDKVFFKVLQTAEEVSEVLSKTLAEGA